MKKWLQPNTNDDSTHYWELKPEKANEMLSLIDSILVIAKILARDFRWLHNQDISAEYDNQQINEALKDLCTNDDLVYLITRLDEETIVERKDSPRYKENKRISNVISNAHKLMVERGIIKNE